MVPAAAKEESINFVYQPIDQSYLKTLNALLPCNIDVLKMSDFWTKNLTFFAVAKRFSPK